MAEDFIDIDIDFLSRTRQRSPDAWGTSQPHNTFEELSLAEKIVIGVENRLDAKFLTQESIYHSSFLVSPTQIKPDADNMVTLDILKKTFGSGWQPTCAEMNTTEQQSKTTWGGPSRKVRRSQQFTMEVLLTLKLCRLQQVPQVPPHPPQSLSILPAISLEASYSEICRLCYLVSVRSVSPRLLCHDVLTSRTLVSK